MTARDGGTLRPRSGRLLVTDPGWLGRTTNGHLACVPADLLLLATNTP